MIAIEALTSHVVPCIIRDYCAADHDACMAAYSSNAPEWYTEAELGACATFLEEGTSYHLVLEHEGRVVGCGGLELRGEGPYAHLVFGCVHRDFQRMGLGATLLAARLALLEHGGEAINVHLEARASVAPFYAGAGFALAGVTPKKQGLAEDMGHLLLVVQPDEVEGLREILVDSGVEIRVSAALEDGDVDDMEEAQ